MEPPPIVDATPPPARPTSPLVAAFKVGGLLVFLLIVVSNIVSIPFVVVGVVNKVAVPMVRGTDAVVFYGKTLGPVSLENVQSGLRRSLPGSIVSLRTQFGTHMLRIHSTTGPLSVPVAQEKLDRVLSEAHVDPRLFGRVGSDLPPMDLGSLMKDPTILIGGVLSIQLSILLIWLVARKRYFKGENALPPFHTGSVFRALLIGVLLALPVSLAANYLDSWLRFLLHVPDTTMWDAAAQFPMAAKAFIVLAGVVGAPILEEIFFRGLLFGLFERIGRAPIGIAFSAIVFGLAHLSDVPTVATITLMGAILAFVYWKTKSIYTTMTIHMVNNALSFWALFGPK